MSLSLEDIKGEFREGYQRTEEVLTGMDAYIMKLENRIESQSKRIAALEKQMAAIFAAVCSDDSEPVKIFVG
jgi:predicted  nucleic acid-binding Zn-ribbon protein